MLFSTIIKYFERGNASICGLRGHGKDMLMANVVVRRKKPYISNVDYGGFYFPLRFDLLECGTNTFENFISGNIKKYVYPYCDGCDVYISDGGIYFPSQYNDSLNKKYKFFPTFMALSRHLGNCNVHYNSQALNRVWDKIREQSDTYIMCNSCKVIFGFVFQKCTIYEKYDSAVNNVKQFRMRDPNGILASKEAHEQFRTLYELKKQEYDNTHGLIKPCILIYRNKSKYDTRRFKKLLEEGDEVEI